MNKTILLSDGLPVSVRVLGLFELVDVIPEPIGPYTRTILTFTGETITQEVDIRGVEKPPKPKGPPPTENDPTRGEWQEYEIYQAALAHERLRIEQDIKTRQDVAAYIVAHCLAPDDRERIINPDDYQAVYHAALVPQITEEALESELSRFFQSLV